MSKYTKWQLRGMAKYFLRALEAGDIRANILLLNLGNRMGVAPNVCLQNIRNMAND